MDYLHMYPDAFVRYYASDMVIHVDSDTAYLVAPKSRSRIAGYFHLSDHPNLTKHPKLNGAVLVEYKTLKHVVSSSVESEVACITTTRGWQSQSDTYLKHSITHNHLRHWKRITPQQRVSYTTTYIRSGQKLGTCVTIGCGIDKHNYNSTSFGNAELTTTPIISRNTTQPSIIVQK